MKEKSIIEVGESRPGREALEAYPREGIGSHAAAAAGGGDGGSVGSAAVCAAGWTRCRNESWAALLLDLKARGLRAPRLVIADGYLGIWEAVTTVFPEGADGAAGITGS